MEKDLDIGRLTKAKLNTRSLDQFQNANLDGEHQEELPQTAKDISHLIAEAVSRLAPLWDLRDYVAVNPLFGLRHQSFQSAIQLTASATGTILIPSKEYFLDLHKTQHLTQNDLHHARALLSGAREQDYSYSYEEILNFLKSNEPIQVSAPMYSLADIFDLSSKQKMLPVIQDEIGKWCAAYFDEGQAIWSAPAKELPLYNWWRELLQFDHRCERIKPGFAEWVATQPINVDTVLANAVAQLNQNQQLSSKDIVDYFHRLLVSVNGWATFIQKFEFESQRSQDLKSITNIGGIKDFLAIRCLYDLALIERVSGFELLKRPHEKTGIDRAYAIFEICLLASELNYRKSIISKIKSKTMVTPPQSDIKAQMVFCIDVRSEVIRRHLERASTNIATLGFAGFFGMPIEIKGVGQEKGDQQCPVLLQSSLIAREITGDATGANASTLARKAKVDEKFFTKLVQSSANSSFSFVETFGLSYIPKFLHHALGLARPNIDIAGLGLNKNSKTQFDLTEHPLDKKLNFAIGALRNMGLTANFARFVFLFGHGSTSSNNPYSGALDCGACAGHSGYGNSKFLAQLLNDPEIRSELIAKGITIPPSTVFIPGWHNTTLDQLNFNAPESLDNETSGILKSIVSAIEKAQKACRHERLSLLENKAYNELNQSLNNELLSRSQDWSEVRPEWGLARNAAFIVADRSLTRGIDFEGRTFLHEYNPYTDPDGSKLELIMTAPMIVTNWINMQYYASTIDPVKFGAGNKAISNVTGLVACVQGNGGDLVGGLTEQSVRLNDKYFHAPIRLQVFINASPDSIQKVINKHRMVRDLVHHGWLYIIAMDIESGDSSTYHRGAWIPS